MEEMHRIEYVGRGMLLSPYLCVFTNLKFSESHPFGFLLRIPYIGMTDKSLATVIDSAPSHLPPQRFDRKLQFSHHMIGSPAVRAPMSFAVFQKSPC